MITFEHVDFYYKKDTSILKNIHFTIQQGEYIAIVGANGCGKSTLSKLINGLLIPKKGTVRYKELDTKIPKQLSEIRKHIGFIFQNPEDQFITTSVRDELIFGLENMSVQKKEMDERINSALQLVGMEAYMDATPYELSGGQKQRVAIAAILAMKPQVIIFDEATSMLDPLGREEIVRAMKELHQLGMTIVHITHHMDEALSAERILLLYEGEIAYDGNPVSFFQKTNLNDYHLIEPFAVRLHRLSQKLPISDDWKGAIRSHWDTN